MSKKITLHIGMHKTATTWFQECYFPLLSTSEIRYNPKGLTESFMSIFRYGCQEQDIQNFISYLETYQSNEDENILLSAEIVCGDLFSGYPKEQFEKHMSTAKRCFEGWDINIIFVIREPKSWVLSCYKESVHEHHYQSLSEFLDGSKRSSDNYVHLDPEDIPISRMIQTLSDYFGDNLNILFYEDFCDRKEYFLSDLRQILGILELDTPNDTTSNLGYSPAMIGDLIRKTQYIKDLGLNLILPKPIFFFGQKSIYIRERYLYFTLTGRIIRKFMFPIRRGRWIRFLARAKDRKLYDRGSFNPEDIKLIEDRTRQERIDIVKVLQNLGVTRIPHNYIE